VSNDVGIEPNPVARANYADVEHNHRNGFFCFLTLFYTPRGFFKNHALTLKSNTAKYYVGEKSTYFIPF
jgi:hypothetical protein